MAGPSKGKKKKNKGKSKNAPKFDNTQQETLSCKLDVSQKQIDDNGGSEEPKKESQTSTNRNVNGVEEIVIKEIELLYKEAKKRLMELGYASHEARKAILMNGPMFSGRSFAGNMLSNAIQTIKEGCLTDGVLEVEHLLEDVIELAKCSMRNSVAKILQDKPHMTEIEATVYLLESNTPPAKGSLVGSGHSKDKKGLDHSNTAEIDTGRMLKENTSELQRLSISSTTPSSPSLSSGDFESNSLDLLTSFLNCPDETSAKDWLRTSSGDLKDSMISMLSRKVENLTAQVQEKREWAQNIVIQAAKRYNAIRTEFRNLRLGKSEIDRLLQEKEELQYHKSLVDERENSLKELKSELESVNELRETRGTQNLMTKAEITAHDLYISEKEQFIFEAKKKERLALKKSNDTEKNVGDLRRQIAEENQNIADMEQKMQQVNEAQEQVKLRLRQEKEAKSQAHFLLLEAKRLDRLEKENSKRRLASVKQELDLNYRRLMDEKNRLELELSQLKAAQDLSIASRSSAVASSLPSRLPQNIRQCIICRNNEVCILFLPCAHQVLCSDCSEEVFEALKNQCPCCEARIEERVKVYIPGSSV